MPEPRSAILSPNPSPEQLLREHGPGVLQVIRRTLGPRDPDVDDCFQDSFVEFSKSGGHAHPSPGALLRRIAAANAIDRIRRRQVERRAQKAFATQSPLTAPPASAPLQSAELLATVQSVLSEIPELQAQAFVLTQFDDLSHGEVALTLGVATDHVAVLVHRARAALKARLATAGGKST